MGWIVVVSGGPGGPEYITEIARKKAQQAEVVIGSKAQIEAVKPEPKQKVYIETGIDGIMELINQHRNKDTAVIVTGDAGIYSLCQRIIDRFGKVAVKEVVPGISSLQVAFARIKEPWLNVRVFSFHGRPLEGLEDVLKHERVAILCDREHNSKVILRKLMDYGLFDGKREIYVCQELTLPEERIIKIGSIEDVELIEVKGREIVVILSIKD
ncbi:MAG: precorrin-6y C5,15-methyltransferase (decarboxylating) subunit CbiE [Nitrospirae bacterium]|nr:precorrin-6y C5,15-methyltransferase (decarboxylating) subunit CbiE [Nitrospirota bacterium]